MCHSVEEREILNMKLKIVKMIFTKYFNYKNFAMSKIAHILLIYWEVKSKQKQRIAN